MSWKTNVENLVRLGQLKRADHVPEDVAQYFADATGFFNDGGGVDMPQSRFLLAYEGLHALSMAILNKAEVRIDSGEGHRQTALQVALLICAIDSRTPGATAAIMTLHRTRNSKTYHSPLPPVSAGQADSAMKALDLMLDAASVFLELPR